MPSAPGYKSVPHTVGDDEKSLNPTPAQKVAHCIYLAERLHTLVLHSLAKSLEMAEKGAHVPPPANKAAVKLRQRMHERVKNAVAWLTLIGSLCGSVSNVWNMVVLLRKLRLARLLGMLGEVRGLKG